MATAVGMRIHSGNLQTLPASIPEVQTSTSLLVIIVVLVITVAASLLKSRRDPEARAHAGTLRDTRDDRRHSPD